MRLKVCVWRRANPHRRDCNVQDPAEALGWKEQPPPPGDNGASWEQEIRKMVDKRDSGCKNNNNKHHGKHVDNLRHPEGVCRTEVKVGLKFTQYFYFLFWKVFQICQGSWLDSSCGTHGTRLLTSTVYLKLSGIYQRAADFFFHSDWNQDAVC